MTTNATTPAFSAGGLPPTVSVLSGTPAAPPAASDAAKLLCLCLHHLDVPATAPPLVTLPVHKVLQDIPFTGTDQRLEFLPHWKHEVILPHVKTLLCVVWDGLLLDADTYAPLVASFEPSLTRHQLLFSFLAAPTDFVSGPALLARISTHLDAPESKLLVNVHFSGVPLRLFTAALQSSAAYRSRSPSTAPDLAVPANDPLAPTDAAVPVTPTFLTTGLAAVTHILRQVCSAFIEAHDAQGSRPVASRVAATVTPPPDRGAARFSHDHVSDVDDSSLDSRPPDDRAPDVADSAPDLRPPASSAFARNFAATAFGSVRLLRCSSQALRAHTPAAARAARAAARATRHAASDAAAAAAATAAALRAPDQVSGFKWPKPKNSTEWKRSTKRLNKYEYLSDR